jgi:hypothetical protein
VVALLLKQQGGEVDYQKVWMTGPTFKVKLDGRLVVHNLRS